MPDEWERNRARRFRDLLNPCRQHSGTLKYRNMLEYWQGADLAECQAMQEARESVPPPADERYFEGLEEMPDTPETLGQEVNRLSGEVGRLRDLVLQRWGKGITTEQSKGFKL